MSKVDDRIAEIEQRAAKATEGPWTSEAGWNGGGIPTRFFFVPGHNSSASVEMMEQDADFVTESRADVPWLCAELRKARKALREIADNTTSGSWEQRIADIALEDES